MVISTKESFTKQCEFPYETQLSLLIKGAHQTKGLVDDLFESSKAFEIFDVFGAKEPSSFLSKSGL